MCVIIIHCLNLKLVLCVWWRDIESWVTIPTPICFNSDIIFYEIPFTTSPLRLASKILKVPISSVWTDTTSVYSVFPFSVSVPPVRYTFTSVSNPITSVFGSFLLLTIRRCHSYRNDCGTKV